MPDFTGFKARQIEFQKQAMMKTVTDISKRLHEKANELERAEAELFADETQFSTVDDRVRRILNTLLWMVPNLPIETLFSQLAELHKLEAWDGLPISH